MTALSAKKIGYNVLYIAVVIGAVLGVWAVAAYRIGTPIILPDIGATAKEFWRLFSLDSFYVGLLHTLLRSFVGFCAATAIAFLLFFLSKVSSTAAGIIRPLISILRSLPTMAASLILVIWAGGNVAPVVLGVLVIAPTLYSALSARTATEQRELVEIARICGAGRARTFFCVTAPTAAAALPDSLSSALSLNIKIVVAAEILMQTSKSLGMLMAQAQAYYMTALLIALVAAAVIASVALELVARGILTLALKRYAD